MLDTLILRLGIDKDAHYYYLVFNTLWLIFVTQLRKREADGGRKEERKNGRFAKEEKNC